MDLAAVQPAKRVYPASRSAFCDVCGRNAPAKDPAADVMFRGRRMRICPTCRGDHALIKEQVGEFGRRFRFVRKAEVPTPPVFDSDSGIKKYRLFRQLYMILLIAKERQEIREKEVHWMVDDMAKKVLRLPDAIARVIAQTYTVCGDDFKLGDDVALQQIRDLLEEIDPNIMTRPKRRRKRLS